LVENHEPGEIAIVDGIFQSAPAVGHAEIVYALDSGWRVTGLSSMGAIRAYELRDEGMTGIGYVFRQFLKYSDFRDDELCLLHNPDAPYHPVTTPLVEVRYIFERFSDRLELSEQRASDVIEELRKLWFGDRDLRRIGITMTRCGATDTAVSLAASLLKQFRVKGMDLESFIEEQRTGLHG
jgi:hypothetical protein